MTTTDIQGVMAAIHGLTEEVRAFQSRGDGRHYESR